MTLTPPVSGGGTPQGTDLPSDFGWLGWTADPLYCNATAIIPTSGTIYAMAFILRQPIQLNNITVFVSTAGATLTAGQSLLAVYNQAGSSRLALSADQSVNWVSTGNAVASMGGPIVLPAAHYWLCWLSVGTTMPTFRTSGSIQAANLGNSGANLRCATTTLTGQTAMPSSITPSSFVSAGFPLCAVFT